MKVIQITSTVSGDHVGLYTTERTDEYVEKDIEDAFAEASLVAEDDDVSPGDIADDLMEAKGITRIYADQVFVND